MSAVTIIVCSRLFETEVGSNQSKRLAAPEGMLLSITGNRPTFRVIFHQRMNLSEVISLFILGNVLAGIEIFCLCARV